MKIVINQCYGGYGLSQEFLDKYGAEMECCERNDPELVAAVEEFGEVKASDNLAKLRVVAIPDDSTDYSIEEYDGYESIIYVKDGRLHWA